MKTTETKRLQKGKATKKRIFAVAKELILAKGYNHVTVDEICERCGLSKGAFYIHYKSKEDIVRKLYRDDMSEYMDEHFAAYAQAHPDASPIDKLRTYLALAFGFPAVVGEELTKLTFVVYLAAKSPEVPSFFANCLEPELLHGIVDDGIARSLFREELSRDDIVNNLYIFITGATMTWCLSDAAYDLAAASVKSADVLLRGLQRNPG
ncbi:TetR/AcrR family transcriptional regulator [Paenibacillus sp. MWE-103]|uniref:TetR/AcrR family transcriptional regulator n=1 Tax=Paenibacillus artemisiicola TaxID=1172618 RepID=A0ABS3W9M7_9BACL|nr:TetR/AcrR family transcriptional regulator [Paenibacillus artemisiicola]MBO7745025.1 TetR/AcrR family transcriptional regulator [Paenibacillus artemisiicola]